MKAAILPSAYYPSLGGVEELVRQLAAQFKAKNDTPIIVANRWPRSLPRYEILDGIPVYREPYRVPCGGLRVRMNYWATTSAIRRRVTNIIRNFSPNVVHIQCVSSGALYALHAKRVLNLPLVVTLQGELTMDANRVFERDEFSRQMMREALAEANVITGCSGKTLSDAERFVGSSFGSRARIIFNGASVGDFNDAVPYRHNRPYVLAIGRLVSQKGFDVLLQAFAIAKIPGWDLIIAGDGSDRSSLEGTAAKLGISNNVRFMGRTDRAITASLFVGSEFVVVPSRADEGLPVVIAEAMAAGKPVLATKMGGIPEAVIHDETGILVDREDAQGLAEGILRLCSHGEARSRMSAASRSRAKLFAWENISDQYQSAYADAVDRHKASSQAPRNCA